MDVGVKDMCYPKFLIQPSLYEERGLGEELGKRERLEVIIEPYITEIMKDLCLKDDLGLDSTSLYEKLDDIYNIIEYLFLLKKTILESYVCGEEVDADVTKERFKYDCVRETLSCRYNLGSLFDKLALEIKIPNGRLGINYMTINDNTCNIFKVHK
jgi:hypothetical protein